MDGAMGGAVPASMTPVEVCWGRQGLRSRFQEAPKKRTLTPACSRRGMARPLDA